MKKLIYIIHIIFFTCSLYAQDSTQNAWTAGADIVSRYVWRGTDFGNAPAIQPTLEYSKKGFAIGAWGSYSLSSNTGGLELDLYASYEFEFGLCITLTDYYFPGESQQVDSIGNITSERSDSYFDYSNSHTFELAIQQDIKNLYVLGAIFINQDNDLYFEVGYNFKNDFSLFAGAGNKNYTNELLMPSYSPNDSIEDKFSVVNIGASYSKELNITEKFTLPISTTAILNPFVEQVHLVFCISL